MADAPLHPDEVAKALRDLVTVAEEAYPAYSHPGVATIKALRRYEVALHAARGVLERMAQRAPTPARRPVPDAPLSGHWLGPHAECSYCGRTVSLDKDGRYETHRVREDERTSPQCPRSGKRWEGYMRGWGEP